MITKCANQMCEEPFIFFRGGKLFIVEGCSDSPANDLIAPGEGPTKLEHFWLCERCAATMTLVLGQGRRPRVISTSGKDVPVTGKRLPPQAHAVALDHARPH